MEDGTSILFGLPGVAVDRVERVTEDGSVVRLVHVVTAASSAAGCPQCGVVSTSVRQYRTTRPRDLPMARSRWRFAGISGSTAAGSRRPPRRAFTESIAEIPARARLTSRLCRQLARQVSSGRSVSAVAAELGVSWPVAHRHYIAYADALPQFPAVPFPFSALINGTP